MRATHDLVVRRAAAAGEAHPTTPAAPARSRSRRTVGIRRHPAAYSVMAAYAVGSTLLMATHTVGITAEHALLLVIVAAAAVAPMRPMVWDWMPFLFVGVMFEDIGTLAADIGPRAHLLQPIAVEQWMLGGNIAAVWLQQHMHVAGSITWYDVLLSAGYLSHFAAPMLAGIWVWLRHRARFGLYVGAYVLVMASGFLVHLLYPQTPPWLAARQGALPAVDRIVVSVLDTLDNFGRLYSGADPEPNGAMPSLHVALPVLIVCFVLWLGHFRHRGLRWLWLLYPLVISFGTLYLGEHYLVDVVAGAALGVLCFLVVVRVDGVVHNARRRSHADTPPGRLADADRGAA